MAVQVPLVLVGPYAGKNKTIKNVPFVNGKATVIGPEDKIMHILKYLRGYGAFPAEEAAEEQAKVDAYLAEQGNNEALLKEKADLEARLAQLKSLEEKTKPAVEAKEAAEAEASASEESPGDADGSVQDTETSEDRSGQQSQGGGNSRKNKRNR